MTPPVLSAVVILHTALLPLSPCLVLNSSEGTDYFLTWDCCTHPLDQVRLQSHTPAGVVLRLKDALPVQSLASTETSFSN